jgi:hypothetical protein
VANTAGMDAIEVASQHRDKSKTTIRAYGWGSQWLYEPGTKGADSVGWLPNTLSAN